jgi:predicted esterase
LNEHHLPVSRSARYFTLGEPETAEHVWIALHGYGQLASVFLGYLSTMQSENRLIAAPEALSRFYHEEGKGPIGASWMTREDREHEIEDYVRYLDSLYGCLKERASPRARWHALGFSQGVATLGRWIDRGIAPFDGICFWAGGLPPELDLTQPHRALAGRRVALAVGNRDSYLSADWLKREGARLTAAAGEVREFPFYGGHRLDRTVLAQVAEFLERR